MKKRIIALLLCAAMLCGMVLASGFALDPESILGDVLTATAEADAADPESTEEPEEETEDDITQIMESVVSEIAVYSENAPTLTGDLEGETAVAKIGEASYTTLADAIKAANELTFDEDAEKTVTIEIYGKTEYAESPDFTGNYTTINFVGETTDAEISFTVDGQGGYIDGCGKDITFTDLILSKRSGGNVANASFMNCCFTVHGGENVSYTNCTFPNGACVGDGKLTTYTGCKFQKSYDKYALWIYGNSECVVDGCTFDNYRGIKMYDSETVLTVKNSNFEKLGGEGSKPAIVLTYGESVTLQNNTYSSTGVFELDEGADANSDGTIIKVLDVNGKDITGTVSDIACVNDSHPIDCGALLLHDGVYTIYRTITNAAAAASAGDTIIALYASEEAVELTSGVILNANGYSLPNVTGGAVAKIGDTYYETLEKAIDAAQNNNTITLLRDVEISQTLDVSANSDFEKISITIDGGGKTIKAAEGFDVQASTWLADIAWNVELKNITFDANNISGLRGVQFYTSMSSLTNVTIKNVEFDGWVDYALHNNTSKLTIYSLTFENCKKGGQLVSARGDNIDSDYQTQLDISSATLSGVVLVVTDSNATVNFGSTKWVTENGYVLEPYDETTAVAKLNENENVFYKSLSAAYSAAQSGNTITLLQSIDSTECVLTVENSKSITLDLSGYTLKGNLVLADVNATITGPSGLNVTSGVEDYIVVYEGGVYKLTNKLTVTFSVSGTHLYDIKDSNGNVMTVEISNGTKVRLPLGDCTVTLSNWHWRMEEMTNAITVKADMGTISLTAPKVTNNQWFSGTAAYSSN